MSNASRVFDGCLTWQHGTMVGIGETRKMAWFYVILVSRAVNSHGPSGRLADFLSEDET